MGFNYIKTTTVYFHVKRNTNFQCPTADTFIPFQITDSNLGVAFNLEAETFTSPRNGVYYFAFVGIRASNSTTNVIVYLRRQHQ